MFYFFVKNIEDEIIVPDSIQGQPIIDAIFSYTTNQGLECEDWTSNRKRQLFIIGRF